MMRNRSALIAGIVAGIASPGTIGAKAPYRLPQGSDLQRMRDDVRRIGGDFSAVIEREHGQQEPRSKSKAG